MASGAILRHDELPPDTILVRIDGRTVTEQLAIDHAAMMSQAIDDLRAQYPRRGDPSGLLADTFTVL
ncbi:hypothetical protein [Rhodococcus sp. NPDC049939]|uniref:hypothetical protein n=1 Tax=Rhodococcus sp. NPDC049939 TaxID=3155511 RepID=UPI0033D177D6